MRSRRFAHGKHVVMVTVEADAFCGPLLAQRAQRSRRRLQPCLWRSAGADLRSGGLGARRRVQRRRRRAVATNGCRISRSRRRRPCGATMGSRRSRRRSAASIRRCSIHSSTAPSLRSRSTAVCNATGLTPAPDGLAYPASQHRRDPGADAPAQRGRRAASQGAGGSDLIARARWPADRL